MRDGATSCSSANDTDASVAGDVLAGKETADLDADESRDYVPSSLKDFLLQEESAFLQVMSSIDALETPPASRPRSCEATAGHPPLPRNEGVSTSQEHAQGANANGTESGERLGQFTGKHPMLELNSQHRDARTNARRRHQSPSDSHRHDQPRHRTATERSAAAMMSSDSNTRHSDLDDVSIAATSIASSRYSATRVPTRAAMTSQVSAKKTARKSIMARGVSLLTKKSRQRYSKNDDTISVMSELSQEVRSEKVDKNNDDVLRQHLKESGLVLLKRLLEFLSECPPALDEDTDNASLSQRKKEAAVVSKPKKRQRGLTLPARAIGWLSSQLNDSGEDDLDNNGECHPIPPQQLRVLRRLLRRVTSVRISGEAWPPRHASANRAAHPEKRGLSTKLMSKISGDHSTTGGDSFDDESCTEPSRAGTHASEAAVSAFRRYYHELQHKPDVDMSLFPNATKVVIDGVPPHWITHLDSTQKLDMFHMTKGCIIDISRLFFPSDANQTDWDASSEEREGDPGKRESASHAVYPSLSKLRLSNCAIGEMAGLRGRKKSLPRLPTFSRFPNLSSLNLSHNEMFKTKTAFAGLASLPLLSSINLSYNRLSSLDGIFMHIGNVTELILTGNCLSSTRGLDRLFSLERLSIDENCISNLANIAGIAMTPFLMNLDVMGNPFFNDPASSRIKVFNLFREVRCKNLPKDATYRDMQRLLPILDREISTKDELVALKELTFRQTVSPVKSNFSKEGDGRSESEHIDTSSEISVNMPNLSNGGIRRIVKSFPPRSVHLRMAGSASLEKRVADRLNRFHKRADEHSEGKDEEEKYIQYTMNELITSIRPETRPGDASTIGDRSCSGELRGTSFSSRQDKGGNAVSDSPADDFPFSLPLALLAEADDAVWNSCSHLDSINPSDNIWDMPYDDKTEQNTAHELEQENRSTEHKNEALSSPDKELNENSELLETESYLLSPGQDSVEQESRKSMFDDIWEQSYRDHVTKKTQTDMGSINSIDQTGPVLLDFNAVEDSSTYNGPSDYGPLIVSSDLDLYFDSYIFHYDSPKDDLEDTETKRKTVPKIQLFKFDRDLLTNYRKKSHGVSMDTDIHERYVGVWKENILACGPHARLRLAPVLVPKRGFHGDTMTDAGRDVMMSESRKIILCLSDSTLYLIVDDEFSSQKSTRGKRPFPSRIPPNSTFNDALWPHAVASHSLHCLSGITCSFQFQRFTLRFSVSNGATSPSLEYVYVILTSNKRQTISLLQKLQSHASIDNDDKTFLDALGTSRSNEVVMHYQILHQIWKRGDREASRRVFVLTDLKAYLLGETYFGDGTRNEIKKDKKLGDVSLAIIDSASLSRVIEVRAANEDPRKITLVILPKTKLKRSHRWRLVCNDGEGAERLIEDVRKATKGCL